jgi:hypothetical protein
MKRGVLLMVAVFVLSGLPVFAVDFSMGVKGGINLAHFGGDDAEATNNFESDSKVGFTGGVFGDIPVKDIISIQPGIFFTLKGQKLEYIGNTGFEYDSFYYIEVPVLVKFYPPIKLPGDDKYNANVFAGPYLGIDLFNRYRRTGEVRDVVFVGDDAEGNYEDAWGDVSILDFGLVFGLGVDIKKFVIEASYSVGLLPIDASAASRDLKNRVATLAVGYKFDKDVFSSLGKKTKDSSSKKKKDNTGKKKDDSLE